MTSIDKEMIDYIRVEGIAKEFCDTFPGEIEFDDKGYDYAMLIKNNDDFKTFALLKHGIIISEDKEVADVDKIHPDRPLTLATILGIKFEKLPYFEEHDIYHLFFIKHGIDKFGDLEEFQRAYDEFKSNYIGFEVNKSTFTDFEVNKAFLKKYKMSYTIKIPKYICNMAFR